MRPRCAVEMKPYEKVWGALLDPVVCGRPQGHTGMHRSVQAIRKERERARMNWPLYRQRRKERRARIREQERVRAELMVSVEAAAKHAREMALRTRQVNW